MRATRKEIEQTLKAMEDKHDLRDGVLLDIYEEEARVVFMGVRRNVLRNVRRIAKGARADS